MRSPVERITITAQRPEARNPLSGALTAAILPASWQTDRGTIDQPDGYRIEGFVVVGNA